MLKAIPRLHDGAAPPHFYGEVTKTPAGCDILRNKGHFPAFARFLREYVEGDGADEQVLHRLKSVLWAVVSRPFLMTCCMRLDLEFSGQHRFYDWRAPVS